METLLKNVVCYVPFEFQGKQISICIHQMRIISQRRVLARKGKISDKRLKEVKTEIKSFLIYDVKNFCNLSFLKAKHIKLC